MKYVKARGVPVLVYELMLADPTFFGSEVTYDLAVFKERCDLIVVNRWSDELADVEGEVCTHKFVPEGPGMLGGRATPSCPVRIGNKP